MFLTESSQGPSTLYPKGTQWPCYRIQHRLIEFTFSPVENMDANCSYGQLWKMQVRKQLISPNIAEYSSQKCYADYLMPLKNGFR